MPSPDAVLKSRERLEISHQSWPRRRLGVSQHCLLWGRYKNKRSSWKYTDTLQDHLMVGGHAFFPFFTFPSKWRTHTLLACFHPVPHPSAGRRVESMIWEWVGKMKQGIFPRLFLSSCSWERVVYRKQIFALLLLVPRFTGQPPMCRG